MLGAFGESGGTVGPNSRPWTCRKGRRMCQIDETGRLGCLNCDRGWPCKPGQVQPRYATRSDAPFSSPTSRWMHAYQERTTTTRSNQRPPNAAHAPPRGLIGLSPADSGSDKAGRRSDGAWDPIHRFIRTDPDAAAHPHTPPQVSRHEPPQGARGGGDVPHNSLQRL